MYSSSLPSRGPETYLALSRLDSKGLQHKQAEKTCINRNAISAPLFKTMLLLHCYTTGPATSRGPPIYYIPLQLNSRGVNEKITCPYCDVLSNLLIQNTTLFISFHGGLRHLQGPSISYIPLQLGQTKGPGKRSHISILILSS
jgi:uncharacterized Zn-finger protein